ncbi:MAG TPA: NAD(P)/FAD-dependent oxidoreductase [Candidatus Polarisedimenticolia bacterium]|nr:NAD(P)/FAD-dependent oxidoreductase [Candidatus Polarisedimenticolia bacterium]
MTVKPLASAYDVVVVGGGPAGSATATLLARMKRRVLLLERERFPRFRIGESLMPASWFTLKRLGMIERLERSPFPRKHSVQFYLGDGRSTRPFYFSEIDPQPWTVTWQIDRGSFDSIMLDNAVDHGVEVRKESAVLEVLMDGDRARGVRADVAGTGPVEIEARVVVDASGQNSLLSRALGLRRYDPRLRNAAIFSRYRGALRDPGIDEGATLVLDTRGEASWFWYIPLPDDVVSVGVVGPIDYLIKDRSGEPLAVLEEEIARCPGLQPRLRGARREPWVRVLRDFSYISDRIAGDGWVLVGDAFGFLDPIYSSGVLLALQGAEFAAESIDDALRAGDLSAARLGRHGARFVAGMESVRHLVYAYYTRDFHFKKFLERYPECRDGLTHVLSGNVFRVDTDRLYASMDTMLNLQDYRPLSLPEPAR